MTISMNRMLAQELNRLDVDGDLGKGFCTLIASRNLLPGTADSLAATCEALGIAGRRGASHSSPHLCLTVNPAGSKSKDYPRTCWT